MLRFAAVASLAFIVSGCSSTGYENSVEFGPRQFQAPQIEGVNPKVLLPDAYIVACHQAKMIHNGDLQHYGTRCPRNGANPIILYDRLAMEVISNPDGSYTRQLYNMDSYDDYKRVDGPLRINMLYKSTLAKFVADFDRLLLQKLSEVEQSLLFAKTLNQSTVSTKYGKYTEQFFTDNSGVSGLGQLSKEEVDNVVKTYLNGPSYVNEVLYIAATEKGLSKQRIEQATVHLVRTQINRQSITHADLSFCKDDPLTLKVCTIEASPFANKGVTFHNDEVAVNVAYHGSSITGAYKVEFSNQTEGYVTIDNLDVRFGDKFFAAVINNREIPPMTKRTYTINALSSDLTAVSKSMSDSYKYGVTTKYTDGNKAKSLTSYEVFKPFKLN